MKLNYRNAAILAFTFALQMTTGYAAVIDANNGAPGDSYSNAGGSNQGQAVGSTGWYYNNVRNSGSVGISTANPQSGNGSASFVTGSGTAKADIEYLAQGTSVGGNFAAAGSLGAFSGLNSFGYDWYRDSVSTTTATLHPSLRVLLDADGDLTTIGDRGGLVFERAYNGGMVTNDTWTTDTVGSSTNLWNFGLGLGFASNINATPYAYDATLAEWQVHFPNAVILGFSSGVGAGWGASFVGAVDNINWQIGAGSVVTSNFEVAGGNVPEPATYALVGTALSLAAWMRRRKSLTA